MQLGAGSVALRPAARVHVSLRTRGGLRPHLDTALLQTAQLLVPPPPRLHRLLQPPPLRAPPPPPLVTCQLPPARHVSLAPLAPALSPLSPPPRLLVLVLAPLLPLVKTPHQVSVPPPRLGPRAPQLCAALLLRAPDPVLQRVAVLALPPPRALSPVPLAHALVGPVVLHGGGRPVPQPARREVVQRLQHVRVDGGGAGAGLLRMRGPVVLHEAAGVLRVPLQGLPGLGLAGPALQRVGQRGPGHGDPRPARLGQHRVRDAAGREHGGGLGERAPRVAALVVDEVPLRLRARHRNVVRRHLRLVKLPLEDEHRR